MPITNSSFAQEFLERISVFSGILDADGRVSSLHGKVFEKTGTDPSLLVGQKFSETVYWQASENIPQILENAVIKASKGKKLKIPLAFRVSSEEIIKVDLFLHPFEDNGSVQIYFFALDVTEREEEIEFYKERSEQLYFAAENAEIGLWFWDLQSNKIYSTPKCNEILEVKENEPLTLSSINRVIHPDDREKVEKTLFDVQNKGGDYEAEFRVIYEDKSINWIGVRGKAHLDENGKPFKMTGIVRKIIEKRNIAEELAQIYERERKARDEAEEANRMKDSFLAIVSHELRTPLNVILGWTNILLSREINQETKVKALEAIDRSAKSQAKLIEDLVDSARIASGKLRLEYHPINLYEIIKTVFNSHQPMAASKNINFEFRSQSDKVPIFGDTIRLQQVFNNLLSNSIKFTPEGGHIEIMLNVVNSQASVLVKDDGQGISADFLPNIFRQFAQGETKIPGEGRGLGLGLSITKILVEKHNGKIFAESEGLGKGSIFTVKLPLHVEKDEENQKREAAHLETKPLRGLKILIVEDDNDSRQVLQLALEQNGAELYAAGSVKDAFEFLKNDTLPDLIISDLAMPEEDGFSFISRLRKMPPENGGTIPAIALSSFADQDKKLQAANSGFQIYHTKPFDTDLLVESILHQIS